MSIETAIFLGAGASKSEGAPLQGELFREYFGSEPYKKSAQVMDQELAAFFKEMFQIDVRQDVSTIQFPTFEEVLGLTDLAIIRKESFRNFDIENRIGNSGRLRLIAQYLVFLVAKVLSVKLRGPNNIHRSLVNSLLMSGKLKDTMFISTNYDILIDNALTELYSRQIDLDYGIEFRNFNRTNDWKQPDPARRVYLFKPHGSLNWLFCPTCNDIQITPKEKSVVTRLITEPSEVTMLIKEFCSSKCDMCGSTYMPLIVPPTFYKDMNNVFLSTIWNRCDNELRKVKHIIFCGYSFPDADIHIKYLLKRAQTNRTEPLKVTVINHYPQKPMSVSTEEEYRYKRFLGPDVRYIDLSFEEFVANPARIFTEKARKEQG